MREPSDHQEAGDAGFIHLAVCGAPGIGKTTFIESLRSRMNGDVYFEEPQDYPFLPGFLDDPLRWSFANQVQFLTTKLRQQAEIKRRKAPAFQEMDALATHLIWTPALRALGWLSPVEGRTVEELFALAYSPSIVSIPAYYVILTGSLETLERRTTDRGRDFEAQSRAFSRLLAMLHASVDDFTKNLPAPHMVVDTDATSIQDLGPTLDSLVGHLATLAGGPSSQGTSPQPGPHGGH
jgi:deoxyadenosine/deoxycytidine kinase